MANWTDDFAEQDVNRMYENLVKDLEDGMLYGKRIGDYKDKNKAFLVAAYFMGMFPYSDPTVSLALKPEDIIFKPQ